MPFSEKDALEASDYNRRKCQLVGWAGQYGRICAFLKIDPATVNASSFARAIHTYQGGVVPKLSDDGKLGPKTWGRLKSAMDQAGTHSTPTPLPIWLGGTGGGGGGTDPATPETPAGPPKGGATPWMDYATDEMKRWNEKLASLGFGANQRGGEQQLTWDEEYFRAAPMWGGTKHELGEIIGKSNAHWCAAFVNYCLHRAGYSHTGSAGAHSFIWRWAWHFEALREPRRGCVIVVGDSEANGGKGKGSHVAFLDTFTNLPKNPDGHVHNTWGRNATLLGGNQSDRVTSRREATPDQKNAAKARKRDFLAVRGQNNVVSPYLWPKIGPPKCRIGEIIPTERPHHCHYTP